MRRKEDQPIKKVTLNLYDGDFEFLQDTYRETGAAKIVRELVRAHRRRIEAQLGPVPEQLNLPLENLP